MNAEPANFYEVDRNLQFEVRHRVASVDLRRTELWLREVGRVAGNELDRLARAAEENPPKLQQYDANGNRVDVIQYHPAYRAMEAIAFERFALAAMSQRPGILGWPTPVPHVVKYALSYVFAQAEFSLLSPVSMTESVARVLRRCGDDELKEAYLPRLTSTDPGALWQGAVFVSERQSGSDIGSTRTVARREGDSWQLYGRKWFCNNVDAEVILTLARPDGGDPGAASLGLFLVPRVLPGGNRNRVSIDRLKNKLGARSVATAEVTFDGTVAYPVGELGSGFKQVVEMINVSLVSNAMRAAGLMRRAAWEAAVVMRSKSAFGHLLVDLPLARANLIDLLVEVEAATAFVLFAAQALDAADQGNGGMRGLARILAPVGKYAICLRARKATSDAMELAGGNGYVEESIHPRLVRDAHLGPVWTGTSNMIALDVLRAITRENATVALRGAWQQSVARCTHPAVQELARGLESRANLALERAGSVAARERDQREPLARSVSDALYDLTAAILLAEEAQWELEESGSARKLLVARLFAEKHLAPRDPLAFAESVLTPAQFDSLVQWASLRPEDAAG